MHPIVRRAFALGAASLAATFALACGGDEEPAAPPPAEQPASPPTTGSADEIRYESETADGEKLKAQLGGDVELPSDFPSDIPVFPGAKPTATMAAGEDSLFVAWSTGEGPERVFDFYKNELPGKGWTVQNEANFGGQRVIEATKSGRKASLAFSSNDGSTRISVAISPSG